MKKPIYIVYTKRPFEGDKVQAFTQKEGKNAIKAFQAEMKKPGTTGYITTTHIQETF